MLNNKLYQIEKIEYKDKEISAQLLLNEKHPVFDGHFPDVPVLPGVSMMYIVKELMEMVEKQNLLIKKSGNMKFLQMINPLKNPQLLVKIHIKERLDDIIRINGEIFSEENICFKISAHLQKK